jgi:hypothetical protein
MRKIFFLVFCSILSCNENDKAEVAFSTIDYSYDSGWKDAFSIRLDRSGKCIVANGRWLKDKKYYIGEVDFKMLKQADSLIKEISECNPDSIYSDPALDQESYKIAINPFSKQFFIDGDSAPECLKHLSMFMTSLRDIKLSPIDTTIAFKSLESFYPPEVKLDSASFLPPTQETER